MTERHCTPATLDGYAGRTLALDELIAADMHLTSCDACSAALAALVPQPSTVLEPIHVERRRHLTFEEIEAAVDGHGATDLDALAMRHLSGCATCRREIDELQAFEARPAAVAPAAVPSPRRRWRLWAPAFAMSGLAAAALVALALWLGGDSATVPGTAAHPLPLTVTLASASFGSADPGSALSTQAGADRLPIYVVSTIHDARRRAVASGHAQMVTLTVPAAQLDAVIRLVSDLGPMDPHPPAPGASPASPAVVIELTVRPPRASR